MKKESGTTDLDTEGRFLAGDTPLVRWGKHTQLQERLDAFLKRARKFGFCDENYTTAELLDKADARLFRLVQRLEHCLHHLLPGTTNSCSVKTQRS